MNLSALIGGKFILKTSLIQDLLSSLNAVTQTNKSTQIITRHVIYNPAYTYKFQLKTTYIDKLISKPEPKPNTSKFKLIIRFDMEEMITGSADIPKDSKDNVTVGQ